MRPRGTHVTRPSVSAARKGSPPALMVARLILLVLLHSGKDSGLSGAFGVGSAGSSVGGGSLVERNLTRWTIGFGILWVLNVFVLLKI